MNSYHTEQISQALALLKSAKRIFILTGAGVSAESGVPTFRGGGDTTMWRGMPFQQLSSAQMVEQDLPLVWEWFDYRRSVLKNCAPNAAHEVLARVQRSGRYEDFAIVTQNIDGLHQSAGSQDVIELHGSVWRARCLSCKTTEDLREIDPAERPPVCPKCADSMRPDVILFGEAMPMQAVYEAQGKAQDSDVCLVIGTSALVYPAAELPLIAKRAGAKIIEINPEQTNLSAHSNLSLRGKAAELVPLIFAADEAPSRLPDAGAISAVIEQNKNEKNAEDAQSSTNQKHDPQNQGLAVNNAMTYDSHPLRVAILESSEFKALENLGLTFAPGKKQTGAISGNWSRDLATDLTILRDYYETDTLVSLIEDEELAELSIDNLAEQCQFHHIELVRFPLPDVSIPPSLKTFADLIKEIVKRINQNKKVVVHCKGGLGRAGLTAACTIVAASGNQLSGAEAIEMVRQVRPGAIETKEQENFVSLFGEYWELYSPQIENPAPDEEPSSAAQESSSDRSENNSHKQFLLYWQERSVDAHRDSGFPLDVVSSRQLKRLNVSDTIWIVTVNQLGELILAGRLQVAEIVDYRTAVQRLNDTSLWDGGYFALPGEGQAEYLRPINLSGEAYNLRFEGTGSDRFAPKDGKINPQQMQTMRELTDKSAKVLTEIWEKPVELTAEQIYGNLDDEEFHLIADAATTEWIAYLNERAYRILKAELPAERFYTSENREYLRTSWENYNLPFIIHLRIEIDNSIPDHAPFYGSRRAADENAPPEEPARHIAAFFGQEAGKERSDAEAQYRAGVAYDNAGQSEISKEYYLRAVELDSQMYAAHYNLGANYLRAGELNQAENEFITAALLAREFAPAHFMLGVVYSEQGLSHEAIAATRRGLEHAPDDPGAHFNIGKSFYALGEYEMAIQSFEQVIELAPDHPDAYFMLGKCYRELGEKELEFNAYLAAAETALHFDAVFALGTVYAHLTGTAEGQAVDYYETGGELDFRAPQDLFYLGLGEIALGEMDEAQQFCARLREINETYADRLNFFIERYEPPIEDESEEFELGWLNPAESGFHIPVIDLRPFTETLTAFAADEQQAITFLASRESDGAQHRGKSPENPKTLSCHLEYPINALLTSPVLNCSIDIRSLPEGKLYAAAEMEDKWDIYYYDSYFYFVRSWTDQIAYRAHAEEEGLYLAIKEIEYSGDSGQSEGYIVQAVDFLLKTFVLGFSVPLPIPSDVENESQTIALSSFSFAGRSAKFASYYDTTSAIMPLQAMNFAGPYDRERSDAWAEKQRKRDTADNENNGDPRDENSDNVFEIKALNPRARQPIEIYIDEQFFEAKNIPELYQSVLQYLAQAEKLENVSLPVATGDKRYILALEPVHPTGKAFLAPVRYGEFYMEAHNNREAAIAQLKRLVENLGYTFIIFSEGTQETEAAKDLESGARLNENDPVIIREYLKTDGEEELRNETDIAPDENKLIDEQISTQINDELTKGAQAGARQDFEEIKNDLTDSSNAEAEYARKLNIFQGCLLGGAVGDALGAAIEFDSVQSIRQKFGAQGLTDYAPAYGRIGAITDDTQMTLFTAEGVLRATTRANYRGICHPPSVIHFAYLRWLETQGIKSDNANYITAGYGADSWLLNLPDLNHRRAPGNTCLSALSSGVMGTLKDPINNSKGCGGVMRVAPIGLFSSKPFELACEAAAITHGHPSGYLSAGVLALIIQQIVQGNSLAAAINYAVCEELPKHPNYEETYNACDKAIKAAQNANLQPSPEVIESLGGGWIAEEALAIAIYCSLIYESDFRKALLLAVNHSGDSDSTGVITGNILGALRGLGAIPKYWLERLELKDEIAEIAEDLAIGFREDGDWSDKYPGV